MTDTASAPPGTRAGSGGAREVLDRLLDSDPAVVERDELADLVAAAARLRGWLDGYELGCARRAAELAKTGRCEPTESMFARSGQRSGKDAAKVADRNDVCDQLGSFEEALLDGRISAGHVDGVAAAMRGLDDATRLDFAAAAPELLDAAVNETVDVFSRHCRELSRHLVASRATSDSDELDRQRANSTVKRWIDKVTGMHHTHLELDPIRDAAVWSVVNARLDRLRHADAHTNTNTSWPQLQVDAVVAAVTAGVPARNVGTNPDEIADTLHASRVPEITITTDYTTLVDGLHDHSICETEDGISIPVSTVRRLCCDAEIIPVVLGTDGVPLDMGRSIRTANRAQRRALRTMYRTCAHPDCAVAFSACKVHHVRWWWRHKGPTDIENLIPLCERHHHLVHEGGWTLTMTPDRVTTWSRPDGTVAYHGPSIDRHRFAPRR